MELSSVFIEIIRAAVAVVVGGGVFASIVAFRKDKREEPKDTAETLKLLLDQAASATAMAMDALNKARSSELKATEAERRATHAEKSVFAFRHIVSRHIVAIIEWIDNGAEPPPPVIDHELREFVHEMQEATE